MSRPAVNAPPGRRREVVAGGVNTPAWGKRLTSRSRSILPEKGPSSPVGHRVQSIPRTLRLARARARRRHRRGPSGGHDTDHGGPRARKKPRSASHPMIMALTGELQPLPCRQGATGDGPRAVARAGKPRKWAQSTT